MVKSYLKYEPWTSFGIIASTTANILWASDDLPSNMSRKTGSGRAYVAANEEVLCWDIKKGELLSRWSDSKCKAQVTFIARSNADQDAFAVGYEDGSIRIWDSKIASVIVNFNGHKSAITSLSFDKDGVRLASGSKDTNVILWDLVAEVGLYKLRGHKDQITGLQFLSPEGRIIVEGQSTVDEPILSTQLTAQENYLVTTSKDSLLKLWDLSSQHCIETHIAQSNGECWALALFPDMGGCLTAGNDGEMKVWSIDISGLSDLARQMERPSELQYVKDRGTLQRQSKDKALEVQFHPRGDIFFVHGSAKAIEIWRVRSDDEVKKTIARKKKRRREKLATSGQASNDEINETHADGDEQVELMDTAAISDTFIPLTVVRTGGRVRSANWTSSKGSKTIELLLSTINNQLEVYKIPLNESRLNTKQDDSLDYSRVFSVDQGGHRTDIRALTLSTDDKMLASAANGGLKIWNVRTQQCIRTFECGYALSCAFLPGDSLVIVGTKSGDLELFDIVTASIIHTVKGHDGAIWTLEVQPDGRSIVSGSADKCAKFWRLDTIQEEIPGTKRRSDRLVLSHVRTLKATDDILSLKISPDSRLIALALLDNTVKVYFLDSLKLFLNLYGHKLPVLNMDISFDSKLIVTCSADKNIRLWGLDFGDCHKAFFAHQDSILQVRFISYNQDGHGHHFFSASKDKMIKYWDGDKFEQIQRLDGHHGEIWALAVSRTGDFLVSASHDKSIRLWQQTDEQIFLEEEKERELEELYETTLTTSLENVQDEDEEGLEVVAAGKQTVETLTAGEKIVEALELGNIDFELMKEWENAKAEQPRLAPPTRNPLFIALGGISAERHVMNVLQHIKAAALEDVLLVLSFSMLPMLFTFLNIFASKAMNIPLTCRILFFMLKTHHKQVVTSKTMKVMLERIRSNLRAALKGQKDEMGYNLAALRFIATHVRERGANEFVDEATWDEGHSKDQRKRGFVHIS